MKIGLSYSRCVRDIVNGNVDIDDVLVIIARTDFDPNNDEQWAGIWAGYAGGSHIRGLGLSNPEWYGTTDEDEARYRQVSIDLWREGKFHQPRKFGAHPSRRPEIWLETILIDEDIENNVAAKAAWDQFQTVAALTDTIADKSYR
jgi:hypothetical protein